MGYIWDIYILYVAGLHRFFITSYSVQVSGMFGSQKKKGPSLVPQVFHVHWSFGRWSLVWLLNKIYDLYVF